MRNVAGGYAGGTSFGNHQRAFRSVGDYQCGSLHAAPELGIIHAAQGAHGCGPASSRFGFTITLRKCSARRRESTQTRALEMRVRASRTAAVTTPPALVSAWSETRITSNSGAACSNADTSARSSVSGTASVYTKSTRGTSSAPVWRLISLV